MHLSNSVSDEIGYVFVAEELEQGKPRLDDTEEALQMVVQGEITDSLSVIGILKLARLKGF